ncbi:MAG: hypothetical protein AAF725_15225 [Acidobacteriota bacterium]
MTSEIQYDCEGCAAPLSYAPGTTSLTCGFCGRNQRIEPPADEEKTVRELDFERVLRDRGPGLPAEELMQGGHEVRCEDCGSHSVLVGQAGRCPFCDSPMVAEVDAATVSYLSPESVLPFYIDRESSRDAFRGWVKSRWFAPNDLAQRARESKIDGVYMPYWTYDSQTTNRYVGQRGEHYYVSESYTDSEGNRRTRQVMKTRWYPASGLVSVAFDDVLIYASNSLPRDLIQRLEPWDLSALEPYDPAYLSGFIAERYRVGLEPGFELAEARMKPSIRAAVRRDIGGDAQRISRLETHHDAITFKHCLLPLWISSFRYDEKVYRFIVNARTGEVAGERPYSVIKIVLTALLVIALFYGALVLMEGG